jgi:two-component system chemotaxis response regulator CheB
MGKSDHKVLVVDDDQTMLQLLEHGLSGNNDLYEVLCANSARKAIEILERIHISIVITDIQMPVMSGLDLLSKIREGWPHIKVILITADDSLYIRDQVQHSGCLHFLEKPIDTYHLRELIANELTSKSECGFAGTLTNIQLPDLIQMCCFSAVNTAIRVRKNSHVGMIHIEEGEIVHAEVEDMKGVEAFYEIFSWRSGSFETLGDTTFPETTIDKNWQYLLMEGHRRMDEAAALAAEEKADDPSESAASAPDEDRGVSVSGRDRELSVLNPGDELHLGDDDEEVPESDDLPDAIQDDDLLIPDDQIESLIPDDDDLLNADEDGVILLDDEPSEIIDTSPLTEDETVSDSHEVPTEASESLSDVLRVLIVDDSLLMCKIITDMLSNEPDIQVVGTAKNGEEALVQIDRLNPDLITLDVSMPVMDGSTALKHIMIKNPCPVVIISAVNERSQKSILDFLMLGAVDFIQKPVRSMDMAFQHRQLIQSIRQAARAKINNFRRTRSPKPLNTNGAKPLKAKPSDFLTLICSGSGGYAELIKMIPVIPKNLRTCVVVIQAMYDSFRDPFCEYLDQRSQIPVQPLHKAVPVHDGRCYVALNHVPLQMDPTEGGYLLNPGKSTTAFFPDVTDTFLTAAARSFPGRVRVILLSGADIGSLGGLKRIREHGGEIIAQNRNSCMVSDPLEKAFRQGLITLEAGIPEIIKQMVNQNHQV